MTAHPALHSPFGSPTRVLIAEDDAELRRLIVRALRKDGYEVTAATDGTELLELVADALLDDEVGRGYDLIVTDIRMPGWSGMQVLHDLKGRVDATPVILITAFGEEATHRLARRLGAVCVLDKPFEMDDLRMIVLNTVKQRHGAAPAVATHIP